MSTTYAGSIRINIASVLKKTAEIGEGDYNPTLNLVQSFIDGPLANQAQVVYASERTLLNGASEEIDLSGALAGMFGIVSFTKIKAFIVSLEECTSGDVLEFGGAAANAWATWVKDPTDVVEVGADGAHILVSPIDGYAVTAGTGDKLKVNNPGPRAIKYTIYLIGNGAVA